MTGIGQRITNQAKESIICMELVSFILRLGHTYQSCEKIAFSPQAM